MYYLLGKGVSLRKIGKKLHRSHTSLSRELSRHSRYFRPYVPCEADRMAKRLALLQRRRAALKNPFVFVYVRQKLRLGWSPEVIAGRLKVEHPNESIHFETIYKYIYSKKRRREKLWKYLELGRKKRRIKLGRNVQKVSKIKASKSIDLRPVSVLSRKTLGHFETDNMEGKKVDTKVLSVTAERMARVIFLDLLKDKKSKTKAKMVSKRLNDLPKEVRLTPTADNGPHRLITNKTGINVYFCHSYHSWEKGTVENRIKKVRRILPKGESLDKITNQKIEQIENWINTMPMKVLAFKTPYEKMQEVLSKQNLNYKFTRGALQERM